MIRTDLGVQPQAWVRAADDSWPPDRAKLTNVTGVECLNKPGRGGGPRGLWTSTFTGIESVSGWVDWCLGERFGGPEFRVWVLHVDPAAEVVTVDSMADLRALLDEYGADPPPPRGRFPDPMFPYVDFDRLAADGFHGVHLTDDGQWATRLPVEPDAPSLYGWDCESTLWFRWPFTTVADLGVIAATPEKEECQ